MGGGDIQAKDRKDDECVLIVFDMQDNVQLIKHMSCKYEGREKAKLEVLSA